MVAAPHNFSWEGPEQKIKFGGGAKFQGGPKILEYNNHAMASLGFIAPPLIRGGGGYELQ